METLPAKQSNWPVYRRTRTPEGEDKLPPAWKDFMGLLPREYAFVNLVLATYEEEPAGNVDYGKLLIQAGYNASNMNSARVAARGLLARPRVKKAIEQRKKRIFRKFDIRADRVVQELASIAFANKQDFYDENGRLKGIRDLPRQVASALQSVEVSMGTDAAHNPMVTQKIRLHDKIKALELLGKHLKLFTDRVEVSNPTDNKANDEYAAQQQQRMLAELVDDHDEDEDDA